MIAEEKRQQVLAAIAQAQDETAFNKIAAMVEQLLKPADQARAGFLKDSVVYKTAEWDAPLPDAAWAHNDSI
ncbi:MAG: hypothetical protein ACRYFK_05315 [Janthinobacterium lividum]